MTGSVYVIVSFCVCVFVFCFFFFFQAEDGIRDWSVTGVQTLCSSDPATDGNASRYTPNLADFNHDGIPEIYVGNKIYSSVDRKSVV